MFALVAVGVPLAGPVLRWIETKKVPFSRPGPRLGSGGLGTETNQPIRGWTEKGRWSGDWEGESVGWYEANGFKAVHTEFRGNRIWKRTVWHLDGTVKGQARDLDDDGRWTMMSFKHSPPWLWNATDQTTPSMPAWMKDDEQWQRALDAQD